MLKILQIKKIYKPIIKENEIGKIYSFAGSPDKFVLKKWLKAFQKEHLQS
ncbi:MAG: hypothetical protein CM15mP126_6260 [Gammaproteobacteria bacterium]|nr:MAG: hypothetical protein CM15mP126_6260 [Gammaproteobacteria bacterium]